jgi:hypothetical protein
MHETGHQLAAIMFTDIVGYTTLISEDERLALDWLTENRVIHKLLNFSSMRVARLYAFSNNKDLAIQWLNKAYDEHYISFFSLNVDPHCKVYIRNLSLLTLRIK